MYHYSHYKCLTYLLYTSTLLRVSDVSQTMLETVVPRSDSSYVSIVTGKHQGQVRQSGFMYYDLIRMNDRMGTFH